MIQIHPPPLPLHLICMSKKTTKLHEPATEPYLLIIYMKNASQKVKMDKILAERGCY